MTDQSAIYTMLAERAGVPAEQMTALLNGDTGLDPMAAAVLAMSASREPAEPDHASCERRLERYRDAVTTLHDQANAAEAMVRFIATTFGACPQCWGLNGLCSVCQGRGGPSFSQPDGEELLRWVSPALTRLGLQVHAIDVPHPAAPT